MSGAGTTAEPAATTATTPPARAGRTPRTLWGGLVAVVVVLTLARFPAVVRHVEDELERLHAVDTATMEQGRLAVMLGTVTALVVALGLQVVAVAAAMALDRRLTRAGWVVVRGRTASLTFLVVAAVLVVGQLVQLVVPAALGSATVLVPLGAAAAVASALAVRSRARWGTVRRLAYALAVAAVLTFVL